MLVIINKLNVFKYNSVVSRVLTLTLCTNRIFSNENDSLWKKVSKFAKTERTVFGVGMSGDYEILIFENLQFHPPEDWPNTELWVMKTQLDEQANILWTWKLGITWYASLYRCRAYRKKYFQNIFFTIMDDSFNSKDHNKSRLDWGTWSNVRVMVCWS